MNCIILFFNMTFFSYQKFPKKLCQFHFSFSILKDQRPIIGVDAGQKFIAKAVREDEGELMARIRAQPGITRVAARRLMKDNRRILRSKFVRYVHFFSSFYFKFFFV